MTTTKQETILKQVKSLHNVQDFTCKVFTNQNGEVATNYVAFYLTFLEEQNKKSILKEIEEGMKGIENTESLKEVNCSLQVLYELFVDIPEVQKRRIACVIPFMGGKASVQANEYFGFTKTVKKQLSVLTAKFVGRVSEYMKLENMMNKTGANLTELQEKKTECYKSARNIMQNFYDVVCSEKYVTARNSDCKEIIHSLQTISLDKENGKLIFTPETIGKTTALLLKAVGNTLNGKTIAARYESKAAEKIIIAEKTAQEKAIAKAEKKEDAEKAALKAERKAAEKAAKAEQLNK